MLHRSGVYSYAEYADYYGDNVAASLWKGDDVVQPHGGVPQPASSATLDENPNAVSYNDSVAADLWRGDDTIQPHSGVPQPASSAALDENPWESTTRSAYDGNDYTYAEFIKYYGAEFAKARWAQPVRPAQPIVAPVSYTHLTLPTKRIV